MTFEMPDLTLVLPEIWVLSMALAILVIDLFVLDRLRRATFMLSQVTLIGAIALTIGIQWGAEATTFSGTYIADSLGVILKVAVLGLVFLAFAYSRQYLEKRELLSGEFYVLGLLGVLGMMVMISAHSLLTLYLGLELMSLCMYTLVAMNRKSTQSTEAAMKYFVLGALASGILLYGMSMLYGASGTLDLAELAAAASGAEDNLLFVFGLVFVLVGVTFKFGAVPFHMWVPDVYEGAPTVITQYIATASKVAAVGLFMRLIAEGLGPLQEHWQGMMIVLAVLSLAIGNVLALVQTNIKRMLAYSAFNHIGFIFIGLLVGTSEGYAAAVFYAVTYALTSAAAFGVVMLLSRKGFEADTLDDMKGLNERSGLFAFVMLILMISLTGIPGTVGFYAKWMVIQSAVNAGMVWLAVLAVIAAVVGAFYYLRIVKLAYFDKPVAPVAELEASGGFRAVLALNGLAILALGILPGTLVAISRAAFGL
jgi:NADH-quinone oxidoreductase subunit N